MTPITRGLIIIISIVICVCIIIYQKKIKKDKYERSYSYLFLLTLFFPVLDISFTKADINLFDVISFLFLVINFDIFKSVKWKYLSLVWLLFLVLIITSLFSEFVLDSLVSLPSRLSGFVVFISVLVILSDKKGRYDIDIFMKLMKMPILYALIWGIIQITMMPYFSLYYSPFMAEENRISSCFKEPQVAGCLLAIFALYEWSKYLYKEDVKDIVLAVLLFVIGCFTGSKTFFIGFSLGFIVTFFLGQFKMRNKVLVVVSVAMVLLTQDYWGQLPVFKRFNEFDSSLEVRRDFFWFQGFSIFTSNWQTGIGTGNFQLYLEKYKIPLVHWHGGDNIYADQPESGYLLWLDEIGIFSILYLVLIFFVLKRKGTILCNISLLVPWLIGFVSVYNLFSRHMVFILFMITAFIFYTSKQQKRV